MFSDEEVKQVCEHSAGAIGVFEVGEKLVRVVMTKTAELLAARGGTMTADMLKRLLAEHDDSDMTLSAHITSQGARVAVLEKEVARLSGECEAINDLHTRATERLHSAEESVRELTRRAQQAEARLQQEQESARTWSKRATTASERIAELEKELAETREMHHQMCMVSVEHQKRADAAEVRCANLSAAGQVLSEHVDKERPCTHPPGMDFCAWCEARRYPCSPTCTHDDAAKPGHPERVKERSEAMRREMDAADSKMAAWIQEQTQGHRIALEKERSVAVTANLNDGHPDALPEGPLEVVDPAFIAGYEQGAEAMRSACLNVVQFEMEKRGASREEWEAMKSAIEGATP